MGLEFATRQVTYKGVPVSLCKCYPFHGSPDLTIKTAPIVFQTEVEGGEEEVMSARHSHRKCTTDTNTVCGIPLETGETPYEYAHKCSQEDSKGVCSQEKSYVAVAFSFIRPPVGLCAR